MDETTVPTDPTTDTPRNPLSERKKPTPPIRFRVAMGAELDASGALYGFSANMRLARTTERTHDAAPDGAEKRRVASSF